MLVDILYQIHNKLQSWQY